MRSTDLYGQRCRHRKETLASTFGSGENYVRLVAVGMAAVVSGGLVERAIFGSEGRAFSDSFEVYREGGTELNERKSISYGIGLSADSHARWDCRWSIMLGVVSEQRSMALCRRLRGGKFELEST